MPQNTKINNNGMTAITTAEPSTTETKESAEISCPHCGRKVAWTSASLFRPFCSERCRLIDLGAWASDSHRIPGADLVPGDEDAY